jgi:hypothetical protein
VPQSTPLGELVTVPLPDPLLVRAFTTLTLKVALDAAESDVESNPASAANATVVVDEVDATEVDVAPGVKFKSVVKMIESSFVPSSRCLKAI